MRRSWARRCHRFARRSWAPATCSADLGWACSRRRRFPGRVADRRVVAPLPRAPALTGHHQRRTRAGAGAPAVPGPCGPGTLPLLSSTRGARPARGPGTTTTTATTRTTTRQCCGDAGGASGGQALRPGPGHRPQESRPRARRAGVRGSGGGRGGVSPTTARPRAARPPARPQAPPGSTAGGPRGTGACPRTTGPAGQSPRRRGRDPWSLACAGGAPGRQTAAPTCAHAAKQGAKERTGPAFVDPPTAADHHGGHRPGPRRRVRSRSPRRRSTCRGVVGMTEEEMRALHDIWRADISSAEPEVPRHGRAVGPSIATPQRTT